MTRNYVFGDAQIRNEFLNVVTSATDEEGIITNYGYDINENRTSTTVDGHTTGGTFQDHYQITRTDAKQKTWTNTWADRTDGAGKVLTDITGPDGRAIQHFDYQNDLLTKTYATDPDNPTSTLLQSQMGYTYDDKLSYADSFVMHSRLAASIGTGDTTLYLTDVTGFPVNGLIRVNNEIMSYGGKNAANNTLTNVQRHALGSTGASANVNTQVSAFSRGLLHYDEGDEIRGFQTSAERLIIDSAGNIASVFSKYAYDDKGRVNSVAETDRNGTATSTTTYTYENLDRVIQTTIDADNLVTKKKAAYSCCHVLWEEDENGHRVYHVYDNLNRATKDITSSASTTLDQPIIDANQMTITVVDGSKLSLTGGSIVVDDEIITYSSRSGNVLTVSARGAQGTSNMAGAHEVGAAVGKVDAVVAYGYDPVILHRKTSLTVAMGHTTNYEYFKNDRLRKTIYPDGTWEQYEYDLDGQVSRKITSNGAVTVYTYDENGRLLTASGL